MTDLWRRTVTHPSCLLLFPHDAAVVHIPADGFAYWVDTLRLHSAMNGWKRDRLHLVGCILP